MSRSYLVDQIEQEARQWATEHDLDFAQFFARALFEELTTCDSLDRPEIERALLELQEADDEPGEDGW
jgi:hypothetical protein